MFTFGRDHEKQCAREFTRRSPQAAEVDALIDAVHDHLEGRLPAEAVRTRLTDLIIHGHSGPWQQAAYWLRRLTNHDPAGPFAAVWSDLAGHPRRAVRHRVATKLAGVHRDVADPLIARLLTDRSDLVRRFARQAAARSAG